MPPREGYFHPWDAGRSAARRMSLPTELPVARRRRPGSEIELIALASLLPGFLSVLLVRHVPAVAQAFLLMGQVE